MTTHGGKRRNAGRKAKVERPHAVQVMLSDEELADLDSWCETWEVSRAEAMRRALHGDTGSGGDLL